MSEKRTGLLKFNHKSGRYRIVYLDNTFDYDEITSGMVFYVKILGTWKKTRCEYDSQKERYYGVDLELPLKEGFEASLFLPDNFLR